MFGLGLQPSGSKDPFALRRQANCIVRVLAEHRLPLRFSEIFTVALEQCQASQELRSKLRDLDKAPPALKDFFRERLEFYLRDIRGYAYDVVNAVLAAGADDAVDAIARAEAVSSVRPTADFVAISTAFKRIKNILRQAREAGKRWPEERVDKRSCAQLEPLSHERTGRLCGSSQSCWKSAKVWCTVVTISVG